MPEEWTREKLQRHIDDQVQESLNLDYKGAGSLDKADKKKVEIHKDVSAMANSAGGVVIYGIREYDDKERKHLPERFDPVDQSVFTREWLEQVISGVQPRIQGLVITSVSVGPNPTDAVFVVEVPASSTAHQAGDKVYYRRHNFQSVGMNDYEVRDVMNRSTHALIDLEFKLDLEHLTVEQEVTNWTPGSSVLGSMKRTTSVKKESERYAFLDIHARNNGAVYAQYVVAYIYLPTKLAGEAYGEKLDDGRTKVRIENAQGERASHHMNARSVYTRNVPVLPGTSEHLGRVSLSFDYATNDHEVAEIEWEVYADNAQVNRGVKQLADLRAVAKVRYERTRRGPIDGLF
jgi:hypothetical protein